MARRMRKRFGATPAEELWRDDCGSALARRLRRLYGATTAQAL